MCIAATVNGSETTCKPTKLLYVRRGHGSDRVVDVLSSRGSKTFGWMGMYDAHTLPVVPPSDIYTGDLGAKCQIRLW